jgi:hypothetical protein
MEVASMAKGNAKTWNVKVILMMVLVVALTWAAIDRLSKKKAEAQAAEKAAPALPPDEAKPLITRGEIVEASWRKAGRAAPQPEVDPNAEKEDQWDLFGDKARERDRRDKELREAVDGVDGLGVYVSTGTDDTEEEE